MLQLPTMREMANCELPLDAKVYIRSLKKEEVLEEGMMIIVQDLLLLAISNGKIYFLLNTFLNYFYKTILTFKYNILICKQKDLELVSI